MEHQKMSYYAYYSRVQTPNAQNTLSIDIGDLILGAYSCKRPVLRKIFRNKTANDISFLRSDRSGQFEDLRMILFIDEGPVYLFVPGTRKK
jgi:hypothetical protein